MWSKKKNLCVHSFSFKLSFKAHSVLTHVSIRTKTPEADRSCSFNTLGWRYSFWHNDSLELWSSFAIRARLPRSGFLGVGLQRKRVRRCGGVLLFWRQEDADTMLSHGELQLPSTLPLPMWRTARYTPRWRNTTRLRKLLLFTRLCQPRCSVRDAILIAWQASLPLAIRWLKSRAPLCYRLCARFGCQARVLLSIIRSLICCQLYFRKASFVIWGSPSLLLFVTHKHDSLWSSAPNRGAQCFLLHPGFPLVFRGEWKRFVFVFIQTNAHIVCSWLHRWRKSCFSFPSRVKDILV